MTVFFLRCVRILPGLIGLLALAGQTLLQAQPQNADTFDNFFDSSLPFQNDLRRASVKLSNDLVQLQSDFSAHLNTGAAAGSFNVMHGAIRVFDGYVSIDAVASGTSTALQADLQVLGMRKSSIFGRMVSGQFPISRLDRLETLNSLQLVRPAYVLSSVGLTTTQGDPAMNADDVRTLFGVDGSGITIGTLSDSYDCLGGAATDVSNNDLPGGVVVLQELTPCGPGTDEGRAMMQLIHDVAPGSSQAFFSATDGGQADFANGILALANTANADIIVDDILFFAEPMFQDGIIAQAVDTVADMGVPYFSSAGNSGRESYESGFTPSGFTVLGGGEAHDFDPGAGVDLFQNITVPIGGTVFVVLQWDSPFFSVSGAPGSANDLDIFLTDEPPTTGVAGSVDVNVGGDALEVMIFTNPGGMGTSFNIVIERFSGANPGLLKYVILSGGTINEFDTDSSTIYGHANAEGAEAVGAAAYFETPEFGVSPPLLESFSSAGPTPILFDLAGDPIMESRQKPQIVCIDGGNTTFFGTDIEPDGFPNFFGTSAAAPHAAAMAALLLELEPSLTTSTLFGIMESTAIDMGVAGVDDDSGYGLCQADLAATEVALTSISVTKSAMPGSVPEPGDDVDFNLRVDNTGNNTVSLTDINDDIHGDLDGQGDCMVPQSIAPGEFYECDFTVLVTGNAGDSEVDTITAMASGLSGVVSDQDSATVDITDVLPTISVTKTASPTSVPEPGGMVTFTVRVDNTSTAESVDLTSLVDDIHGDLNGQGSCSVPQVIAVSGFYQCSFSAMVNGNAGESETDTVTASASDDDGNNTQAMDSATVDITDVLPTISVTKTASPTEVEEPGGSVTFTARIDNTSIETLTLTSLNDDIHGDLDGQGNCMVPQVIAAGAFYECSFTADVLGNAGESETDTITANADDDDGNTAISSDSATVNVIAAGEQADLNVLISDSEDPTLPGATLVYTVTVTNNGPDNAEDVVITDTFPVELTLVSTSGCLEDPNGVPTCSLGTVLSNTSVVVTITVTVDDLFTGEISNTVTVTSSTTEAAPGDESATEITEVLDPDVLFKDGFEDSD